MAEHVKVLQLGDHEYAAEVHEAGETTEHRVSFGQGTLDALALPDVDERSLIVESVHYLLQEVPVTALSHDIDLDQIQSSDAEFVPELRARLT